MKTFKAIFLGVLLSLSIGVQAAGTQVQENGSATTTPATTITHTFTSTATSGNPIAVCFAGDKDTGIINTPAGYTAEQVSNTGDVSIAGFWKISDGTETAITVTYTTSQNSALHITEYSGLDNFDDSNSVFNTGTSVSARLSGSVTNADADARGHACFAADSGANVNAGRALTNSWTEVNFLEAAAGGAPGLVIATLDISAVAAQETEFSTTGGDQMSGLNMMFDNSGGGGGSSIGPLLNYYRQHTGSN